jgi:hypothetical protein
LTSPIFQEDINNTTCNKIFWVGRLLRSVTLE